MIPSERSFTRWGYQMYCTQCGAPVSPGSSFCGNCGWQVAPKATWREEVSQRESRGLKLCVKCRSEIPLEATVCHRCDTRQPTYDPNFWAPAPVAPAPLPERRTAATDHRSHSRCRRPRISRSIPRSCWRPSEGASAHMHRYRGASSFIASALVIAASNRSGGLGAQKRANRHLRGDYIWSTSRSVKQ